MIHPDWLRPDWTAPPGVRAFVTTRAGGVSTGPYASLNLGTAVGDAPEAVAANRARVRAALPGDPAWLKQVHGTRLVDAATCAPLTAADASYTIEPGVVCVIQVADCLPVLFTDRAGTMVAAAHAGWRGLVGGVLATVVAAYAERGIAAGDLLAWIGPGIGAAAFEVGDEVHAEFTRHDAGAAAHFVRQGATKWRADLHALAQRALRRLGVAAIHGAPLCTVADPQRFFSYRRDHTTGRMAAFIWRE